MTLPVDYQARLRAIDPTKSFIVQAPAGSGKTELLTQRFLKLLITVNEPEQIVALTFTKKAAGEMRERVIRSLVRALNPEPPESTHELFTYELSLAVLSHDNEKQWGLLENANRLQIQTLDSLSATLAKQRPLISKSAGQFRLTDRSLMLYTHAARNVIKYLNDDTHVWFKPLQNIIQHLDVNLYKAEMLFIEILSKREQWLPYLYDPHLEQSLLNTLETIGDIALNNLNNLDSTILKTWYEIACYSSKFLEGSLIENTQNYMDFFTRSHLDKAKQLADLLLTNDGNFRKKLSIHQGFPPKTHFKSKEEQAAHSGYKNDTQDFLNTLANQSDVLEALQEIRRIPTEKDFEDVRELICDLAKILPLLIAELHVVFNDKNQIDFIELSSYAQQALGEYEDPTDLQLRIDHSIKHILVDEFQDTSISQYKLLEKLTSGWEVGDGRSLFFVGDPMQSIYRFRQAEVGLFISVQTNGFANLPIEPLKLKSNFRSSPVIIDWVNQYFNKIFPQKNITHLGSVQFDASHAEITRQGKVDLHLFLNRDDESNFIANYVKDFHKNFPDKSLAILARTRNHIQTIARSLKLAEIPFNATELDLITNHILIDDLFSLTTLLLFPNDKLALLALARSPIAGLKLDTIEVIAHSEFCIETGLFNPSSQIDSDELDRFIHLTSSIQSAIKLVKIIPIAEIVEQTWIQLHGDKTYENPHQDSIVAEAYFKALEKIPNPYNFEILQDFKKTLGSTYIDELSPTHTHIEVMTIHKSKGLEFDCVIIPSLANRSKNNSSPILRWSEFADDHGQPRFLLAPIKNHTNDHEPIHDYLSYIDSIKSTHELQRLFYVAVTRAKETLLLTASHSDFVRNDFTPPSQSLLSLLWPFINPPSPLLNSDPFNQNHPSSQIDTNFCIKRIPMSLVTMPKIQLLETAYPYVNEGELEKQDNQDWHSIAGTVLHQIYAELFKASDHVKSSLGNAILSGQYRDLLQRELVLENLPENYLDSATSLIETALHHTITHPTGEWLLSQKNSVETELPLLLNSLEGIKRYIIDLTFIDENQNRWIIDHKLIDQPTLDQTMQEKIKRQYRKQVDNYAKCFSLIEPQRFIKLGLYLPLQATLLDWNYEP